MKETMKGPVNADGLGSSSEVRVAEQAKWLLPNMSTNTESNTLTDRNPGSEGHPHPSEDYRQRVDGAHEASLLHRSDPAHPGRAVTGRHESLRELGGNRALGAMSASGLDDLDSGDHGSTQESVSQIVTPAASKAVSPADDASATQDKQGCSSQQDWLTLHAADLIRNIQNWADALDSRKMQLDVRVLRYEQRERRFRLRWQDFESDLSRQRNAIDQLQQEFNSQSRQMDQQ